VNQPNTSKGSQWLWLGLLALVLGAPALADPGDPADPPGRVARLSYLNGSVSFQAAGTTDWVQAVANRPLGTGDAIWADSDSRAELGMGRIAARLDSQTSLTVTNLDDNVAQLQLAQGTLVVSVRNLLPGDNVEIDTPNLAFTATRAGTYRLNVAADGSSTFVAVESGQGNVTGQGQAYTIGDHQAYSFSGNDLSNSASYDVPAPDDFDQFVADREHRLQASQAARYVSPEVIGYEDLDNNGNWQDDPQYGHVWIPANVDADWAPYHDGHWAWVDPWGWTWVDAAPWGFAPFHYGRWAQFGPRWGWIPGPIGVAPVYAPALVAFVGGGGVGVSVSLGVGVGIGWFPLGPREIYRPAYAVGPGYINRINVSNTTVTNTYVTNVINNRTVVNNVYVNQRVPGAVTAVSASAFSSGASVARVAVAVPASVAVKASVVAVAPIAPTARSVAASAAVSFHPPAAALSRPMVARTAPPPAPVPFAAKAQLLAKDPGRPLTAEANASVRASLPPATHAAITRPVNVVAPPAGARAPSAPAAAAHAAAPAAVSRPQAATPGAREDVARPPQAAQGVARPPKQAQAPRSEEQARPAAVAPHPQAHPPAPPRNANPPRGNEQREERPAQHNEEHRGGEKKD
jgi:hypothetical protein